jgi:hypothetical protein
MRLLAAVFRSALLCLSFVSVPSLALEFEFKGVAFGSTMEQLKAAHPDFICQKERCHLSGSGKGTYAGEPFDFVSAEFHDGRLAGIFVGFKPPAFDAIASALTEKYGVPTSAEKSEYRTRGGLTAMQDERSWEIASAGYMLLRRFGSSITGGYLAMMTTELRARQAAEAAQKKRSASGDI